MLYITRIFKLPSGEPSKLRLELIDGSFADIWVSASGKYSFHWDRFEIDGTIYRFDNAPHKAWEYVETFPHHFHDKNEKSVIKSDMPATLELQMKYFMEFTRNKIVLNSHRQI